MTDFAQVLVGSETVALGASYQTKMVASAKASRECGKAMDKLRELIKEFTEVTSLFADRAERVRDAHSRLMALPDDPASADCRIVKGRMMQRGDRRAQYTRALDFGIAEAEKARKALEAVPQRLRARQAELSEVAQRRKEADAETEEARLKWVASL